MVRQLDLEGLPQASYLIRVYCRRCCHLADLKVGIETLHSLLRFKCSNCGGGGRDVKVEMLGRANLGG
jgi:hypothetical protein